MDAQGCSGARVVGGLDRRRGVAARGRRLAFLEAVLGQHRHRRAQDRRQRHRHARGPQHTPAAAACRAGATAGGRLPAAAQRSRARPASRAPRRPPGRRSLSSHIQSMPAATHERRQHAGHRRDQWPVGPRPAAGGRARPRSPAPNAITSSSKPTTPSSASISSHSEWASRTNSGSEACSIHQDWYEPAPRPSTGLVSHSSTAAVHSCQRPLPVELSRCERVKSPSVHPTSRPDGFLKFSNLSDRVERRDARPRAPRSPRRASAGLGRQRQPQAQLPVGEPAPGPVEGHARGAEQRHEQRGAVALLRRRRRASGPFTRSSRASMPSIAPTRARRPRSRSRPARESRREVSAQKTSTPHGRGRGPAPRRGQVDRRGHRGHGGQRQRAQHAPAAARPRRAAGAGSASPARIARPFQ